MSEWEKSDRRAWLEAFIVSLIVLSSLGIIAALLSSDVTITGLAIFLVIYFSGMSASILKDYFKAKYKRCPFIHNCSHEVSEKYFETYCNSKEYLFCRYLPKPKPKPPVYQTPSSWLHAKERGEDDG